MFEKFFGKKTTPKGSTEEEKLIEILKESEQKSRDMREWEKRKAQMDQEMTPKGEAQMDEAQKLATEEREGAYEKGFAEGAFQRFR